MESLWRDARYALSLHSSNRLLTLTVVLSLGLAIGAATGVFSFVDAVILRPLPYTDPDRLVLLWASRSKEVTRGISMPDFADLRTQNQTFESIATYRGYSGEAINFGAESSRSLRAFFVGPDLFSVLGVQPLLGRVFRPDEDQAGSQRVTLLSYSFWAGEFGADQHIISQAIILGGEPYTVIGVMPPYFFFPNQSVQVWLPIPPAEMPPQRSAMSVHGIARLKPKVTLARAQGDVDTTVHRLAATFPDTDKNLSIGLFPLVDQIVGDYRTTFCTLLGSMGLLLLIACANITHMMLVRGIRRAGEFSVRMTLGATRGMIFRQVVIESLLLSLCGGVVGVFVAFWGTRVVLRLRLTDIPRLDQARVDLRTMVFALVVSVSTGVLVGLLPALRLSRPNLAESLKVGGMAHPNSARSFGRDLLLVTEVAFAFVLVVGAGLLVNSFARLAHLDWGFCPDHVLVVDVQPPRNFAEKDIPRTTALIEQIIPTLMTLPGVKSVAVARGSPITNVAGGGTGVTLDGKLVVYPRLDVVGPSYFKTIGIPVLRGREFSGSDDESAPRVAVVSKPLAERLWPGQDPLGKRLFALDVKEAVAKKHHELWMAGKVDEYTRLENDISSYNQVPYDVVGEVGAALAEGPLQRDTSAIYVNYQQQPAGFARIVNSIFLLTSTQPSTLVTAVRTVIGAAGNGIIITDTDPLKDRVMTAMGGQGSNELLLVVSSVTSGLALLLAALGVYGVFAFATTLRTHEIGVRIALGAERVKILRMILGRGLVVTTHGLLFGSMAATLATKTLHSYLFGITPTDPATFAAAALLFLLVSVLACYIPARRAMQVDPMVALRYE